jgi:hypothetical protein
LLGLEMQTDEKKGESSVIGHRIVQGNGNRKNWR